MTVIAEALGIAGTTAAAATTTTAAAAGTTSAALLAAPAGLGAGAGFSATIGAGATATAISALQTGFSLASAASSLFGGDLDAELSQIQAQQTAEALEFQSEESKLLSDAERIRGLQESGDILSDTNKILHAEAMGFAANGLDVSFGTTVTTQENSARNASIQKSLSRDDAQVRALAQRRRSRELLLQRDAGLNASGYASSSADKRSTSTALNNLYDLGLRRYSRG